MAFSTYCKNECGVIDKYHFLGACILLHCNTKRVHGKNHVIATFSEQCLKSRQLRNFANAVYRDWPTYETDFVEEGL